MKGKLFALLFSVVISPASGQMLNGVPTPPTLGFTPQKVFNVDSDYGASGNGVSDDQSAINRAATACGAAGGGHIILGPKRYLVDTVGLSVPTGCTLYCPAPLTGNANPSNYSTQPYSIILNSSVTITMAVNSRVQGCNVYGKGYATSSAWNNYPNLTQRDTLNLVASFAGTAFSFTKADVAFRDVNIIGFALGVNGTGGAARTRMDHVNIDATACLHIDNSHDISRFSHVECFPFGTSGFSNAQTSLNIAGIANNGSGAYRVTLASSSAIPVTGDSIWIDQTLVGPQSIQARRWTITAIDATHIDLQGSQGSGAFPATGTTNSGTKVITGLSSTASIGVGQSISGTNIPVSTTVTWVSTNGSDIGISNSATGSGSVTLTFTDSAYTSGGKVNFDASFRTGIGMEFTTSEGINALDLFVFGHQTQFHLGTAMAWFTCVACWTDGPMNNDVSVVSLLVDGTANSNVWQGGRLNNVVAFNSSSSFPAGVLSGTVIDSTASNWVPIIEIDQGSVVISGVVSPNGAGYYLFKDAMTSALVTGSILTGSFQTETSAGAAKLQAGLNIISANNFAGVANFGSNQVTIGGGGSSCAFQNGVTCGLYTGGQYADLSFAQTTVTSGGSYSPSGNSHSAWIHATATLSTLTITMPTPAKNGQELNLFIDQSITTLTMSGTSSVGMPTTTAANTWYKCLSNGLTQWVCGPG